MKPNPIPAHVGNAVADLVTWRRLCTAACLTLAAGLALASPATPGLRRRPIRTTCRRWATPRAPTCRRVLERKLGEEIMDDIRRDHDYLDDDAILEYLNDFGNTLVAAAPGARGENNVDYFFFAVRDPMINAFALPGGFVAVHSALLIAAQNESELASVLSHEIGHVQQRHIARMLGQQKQDALLPLAALILAALVGKAGGGGDAAMGVMMGGQGLAMQRQLNFSRDAEREADRVGFQTMRNAGFDTSGMVSFFKRLQSTHPRLWRSAGLAVQPPADRRAHRRHPGAHPRQRPRPASCARTASTSTSCAPARACCRTTSQAGRDEALAAFKTQLAERTPSTRRRPCTAWRSSR